MMTTGKPGRYMEPVMRESEDLLECAPLTVHKFLESAIHRKTAVVTNICHRSFFIRRFGAHALPVFLRKNKLEEFK